MDNFYGIVDRKNLALRGLVAVIFGIIAIMATGFVLDFLVYAFGFFAIISVSLRPGSACHLKKPNSPDGCW